MWNLHNCNVISIKFHYKVTEQPWPREGASSWKPERDRCCCREVPCSSEDLDFLSPEGKGKGRKKRKKDPKEDLQLPTPLLHKNVTLRRRRPLLCSSPETPTKASGEGPCQWDAASGFQEEAFRDGDTVLPGLSFLPISPKETQAGAAQAMAEKYSSELVGSQMNPIGADRVEMEVSEHVVEKEEEEKEKDDDDVASMAMALGSRLRERPQEASVKDSLRFKMQNVPEEGSERLEGDHLASTKVSPTARDSEKEVTLCCLAAIRKRRVASEPRGANSGNGAEPARASDSHLTSYGFPVIRQAFMILSDSKDPDAAFEKLGETDWTYPKVTQRLASHRAKCQREEEQNKKEEVEEEGKGLKDTAFGSHSSNAGKRPVTISSFLMGKENAISKDVTDKFMVP